MYCEKHDLLSAEFETCPLCKIERLEDIIRLDTCCAYCGQPYPKGTPRFGDNALTEHIRVCPEHPMRELEQKLKTIHDSTRPEVMDTVLKSAREHFVWIHNQSGSKNRE